MRFIYMLMNCATGCDHLVLGESYRTPPKIVMLNFRHAKNLCAIRLTCVTA